MSKFKVGDTVRRIEDGSNGNAVTKGNLYEVKEVSGSSIIVIDDTGKRDGFCIKKFELVSSPSTELTSLPEKWCIKITDQNKYSIEDFFRTTIAKEYRGYTSTWRLEAGATLHYPQTSMGWGNENGSIDPGYTEITFDQFKKWVLGNPRKEDLLAEAKKRFPLGTTFYPVSASTATVSKEVGTGTVKSELDIKWLGEEIINGSNGYLYSRGTWAEIVSCNTVAPTPDKEHKTESLLEEAKRRYPVGTKYHIAHLSADGKTTAIVRNPNAFFLHDGNVYESHGNYGANGHSYDEILYHRNNEKWAEIISRPEERSSIYWECIQPSYYNPPAFKLGTVYKQKGELTGFDTINFEEDSLGSKTNGWSKEFFKPSTREAYDAQFKKEEKYIPKIGDWVMIADKEVWNETNFLGEGGRVTHRGPFKVEDMTGEFVKRMSGIEVTLNPARFKRASASEIAAVEKQEDFKAGDWVVVLPEDSYFKNSEKCAQRIRSIDPSPKNTLPYQLEFKNGSTNTYKKIRKATPEEIADVNGGYKAGIYKEPASTHSSGLLSPDVGPVWNKGLLDFPSSYAGTGVSMLGGVGGGLSDGKSLWQGLPDFEVRTEELNPMEIYKRYGINLYNPPPKPQPSSKVSVKSHEEFKITVNKPKTIKI